MPIKDPEKRRKYRREWYAKNRESEKAHTRRRKNELRKWFSNYKNELKCSRCPENHSATLEFHHRIKKEKESDIAQMLGEGFSIARILSEIKKCDVVCANCHRKIHFDEKQ